MLSELIYTANGGGGVDFMNPDFTQSYSITGPSGTQAVTVTKTPKFVDFVGGQSGNYIWVRIDVENQTVLAYEYWAGTLRQRTSDTMSQYITVDSATQVTLKVANFSSGAVKTWVSFYY